MACGTNLRYSSRYSCTRKVGNTGGKGTNTVTWVGHSISQYCICHTSMTNITGHHIHKGWLTGDVVAQAALEGIAKPWSKSFSGGQQSIQRRP